jgi:signal transduction histidine kinase
LRADISFTDNGIGIDEENLLRVFEMFYRASEQSDGSGIGLYIVKNAVDKLGGKISVQSKCGVGTRFHIVLPNKVNNVVTKMPHLVSEK